MSWNETPTHWSWIGMRQRCFNPNRPKYILYGGRGITVCERWLGKDGFANFLADMGERPSGTSLDRIDPDGNYEPGNCRWASVYEQNRNKRTGKLKESDVLWVRENAGVLSQTQMASRLGVAQSHISQIVAGKAWAACPGSSSSASTQKTPSTSVASERTRRAPARTTGSRSSKGRGAHSSARSTATSSRATDADHDTDE